MLKKILSTSNIAITGLILLAVISRLFPVDYNLSPVLAIAIFGGYYLSDKRIAYLLPIGIMFMSDLALHFFSESLFGYYAGFHSSMPAVYAAFLIAVVVSRSLINKPSVGKIGLTTLSASVIFFLVTNFSSWIVGLNPLTMTPYPKTLSGLLLCYEMALPFFRHTLISTVAFSAVMFGSYEAAKLVFPVLQTDK
jgi:hypothetical protein